MHAIRLPWRVPGGGLLLLAATLAWAQGVVIPDLRNPALYRESAPAGSCRVCGEIRSIREVTMETPVAMAPDSRRSAGGNPNDWAVVGAAIVIPTTAHDGPTIGAVGTREMVERFDGNAWEITVLMDDGERRTLRRRDGTRFRVGQRVTMSGSMMEPL